MSKVRRKSFHKDSGTGKHYEHDHDTGESRWMEKSEVNDLPPGEKTFRRSLAPPLDQALDDCNFATLS